MKLIATLVIDVDDAQWQNSYGVATRDLAEDARVYMQDGIVEHMNAVLRNTGNGSRVSHCEVVVQK